MGTQYDRECLDCACMQIINMLSKKSTHLLEIAGTTSLLVEFFATSVRVCVTIFDFSSDA